MKLGGDCGFLFGLAVFPAAQPVFTLPSSGGLPSVRGHGLTRFAGEDIIGVGVGGVREISGAEQQVGQDLVDVLEAAHQTTGKKSTFHGRNKHGVERKNRGRCVRVDRIKVTPHQPHKPHSPATNAGRCT